jgi:hypothetical protein
MITPSPAGFGLIFTPFRPKTLDGGAAVAAGAMLPV